MPRVSVRTGAVAHRRRLEKFVELKPLDYSRSWTIVPRGSGALALAGVASSYCREAESQADRADLRDFPHQTLTTVRASMAPYYRSVPTNGTKGPMIRTSEGRQAARISHPAPCVEAFDPAGSGYVGLRP